MTDTADTTGADTAGTAAVTAVTEATYREVVLTPGGVVLAAFMSETDSTCRALRPILTDLARERAGRLSVATIDVVTNPALVQAWGVTQVPVMLLFHQGVLQRVLRGVRPYARLIQEIDEIPTGRSRYPALLRRVHEVPRPR